VKPVPPNLKPPWFQPWISGWKRELALPLYLYWPFDEVPPWDPGEPDEWGNVCAGRIVQWGDARYSLDANQRNAPPQEPIPRESIANLCATDIVYAPLFAGVDHGGAEPPQQGKGFDDRWPEDIFRPNYEAMVDFAPRVLAVVTGNLFAECVFAQYVSDEGEATEGKTQRPAGWGSPFAQWQMEIRARRFLFSAAEMVRSVGGQPAFAPVPYEIRLDCFAGFSRIRDMIRQLGALFITFNGDDILEHYDQTAKTTRPEVYAKHEGPWEQLHSYFAPMDCICGIEWDRILDRDTDAFARLHGFRAMT
jgi:hypothetical protein